MPEIWRRGNVAPTFKNDKKEDPGDGSLTTVPGKLILETISGHMKDRKVIGSGLAWIRKGKSSLTNLLSFYSEVSVLALEGRFPEL